MTWAVIATCSKCGYEILIPDEDRERHLRAFGWERQDDDLFCDRCATELHDREFSGSEE